ncbi:peptide-methionine (S)-S-oxide reductase MsrA [Pontiellaceae bacterium B1224]|nr:peptide-methionine (S)-S-oxide reductase MsrA [Pontiellaceae bacterium B1224]
MKKLIIFALLSVVSFTMAVTEEKKMDKAIFAGGCFWGVEGLFEQLDGVQEATSGYIGGHTDNPTYKDICYKDTGHAEAVEVVYDPATVTYEDLCLYFWRLHDPTTVNRQGPDRGSQYRSAIFYLDEEQKETAEKVKTEAQKKWKKPIVTEIVPATTFYRAEEYHQDYFKKHGAHGCHYLRD